MFITHYAWNARPYKKCHGTAWVLIDSLGSKALEPPTPVNGRQRDSIKALYSYYCLVSFLPKEARDEDRRIERDKVVGSKTVRKACTLI